MGVDRSYEFTEEARIVQGVKTYRIRAVRDIPSQFVKEGDLGGFLQQTSKLNNDAWIADDAVVYGSSVVCGNARVSGESVVSTGSVISKNAVVRGSANIVDSLITGSSIISGSSNIVRATVTGDSRVSGDSIIKPGVYLAGTTYVSDITLESSSDVINAVFDGKDVTVTKSYIRLFGFTVNVDDGDDIIKMLVRRFDTSFTTYVREWCNKYIGLILTMRRMLLSDVQDNSCRHE